jgi:hypothetical protein
LELFDSSQLMFGAVCVGLALAAYIGYKIVKKTIMLALTAFLAVAAAGGLGAYYVLG